MSKKTATKIETKDEEQQNSSQQLQKELHSSIQAIKLHSDSYNIFPSFVHAYNTAKSYMDLYFAKHDIIGGNDENTEKFLKHAIQWCNKAFEHDCDNQKNKIAAYSMIIMAYRLDGKAFMVNKMSRKLLEIDPENETGQQYLKLSQDKIDQIKKSHDNKYYDYLIKKIDDRTDKYDNLEQKACHKLQILNSLIS